MSHAAQGKDEHATRDRHDQNGVDQVSEIAGIGRGNRGQHCNEAEDHQLEIIPHFSSLLSLVARRPRGTNPVQSALFD